MDILIIDFQVSDFQAWGAPVLAFLAVLFLVPPMRMVAPKIGLVDAPGGRKKHEGVIPLIGGLILFPVFILFSILSGDDFGVYWPLYAAILVLLVTGAVDDKLPMHPLLKFGLQFIAAILIVVPGGAQIYQLGDLFGLGDVGLDLISLPFSIIAVVLLINAINLMDGLDGLAGGVSLVILGWMLFACIGYGEANYSYSMKILIAALVGFLFYNMRSPFRKKAVIFMGDAGSMCLGLMIAWYAIHLSPENARVMEPMAVAWVLAIPIWDECAQFYRRVCEGRHPFSPDRGHFHHHFIRAGISTGVSVWVILGLVFLAGGFGVIGVQIGVPLAVLTVLWIAMILGHMAYSKNTQRYLHLVKRLAGKEISSTPSVKPSE